MSVKHEYDLDSSQASTDNGTEGNLFETEQDYASAKIDIKLEFPTQSNKFALQIPKHDKHQHDNKLTELKDPLELPINNILIQPIPKPNKCTTKLKKITPAICTKCNLGFPSAFLFEHHMIQIHQDDRPYPCKHCAKPFASLFEQKRHETIHNPKRFQGEPQFSCDLCPKSYHLQKSLQTHKSTAHLGYKPPKRNRQGPVKEHHSTSGTKNPNIAHKPIKIPHSCPHCDLTFDYKFSLQKHVIVHSAERPFSCTICQATFTRKSSMQKHIQNIHENRTSDKTPRLPVSQRKQPCRCTICGNTYSIPSLLSRHMSVHTGEKPHSCSTCKQKFRTRRSLRSHMKQTHLKGQVLSNPLVLFKCRICGRNDFIVYTIFKRHRDKVHKNIPYESEKEKPFGCGICGKPYFLREDAMICALLGHDPGKVRKEMFKVKCPECPQDEIFWFHNYLALRRHWDKEHADKKLPAKCRVGMYDDRELKDELPLYKSDKYERERIKAKGFTEEELKSELPLYIEFDLLEVREEEQFSNKMKQKVNNVEYICTICGLQVSSNGVLTRHVKVVHGPGRKDQNVEHECTNCGHKFRKAGALRQHERKCHSCKVGHRNIGQQKMTGDGNGQNKNDGDIRIENGKSFVNINDQSAVKAALNYQNVQVYLTGINFN